jgi:hypothetical protein
MPLDTSYSKSVSVDPNASRGFDTGRRNDRETPIVYCRYLSRPDTPCTAEVIDPSPAAHIFICTKHAARVMRLLAEIRADSEGQ